MAQRIHCNACDEVIDVMAPVDLGDPDAPGPYVTVTVNGDAEPKHYCNEDCLADDVATLVERIKSFRERLREQAQVRTEQVRV